MHFGIRFQNLLELAKKILTSNILQSVSSLESIVKEKTSTHKPIPSTVYSQLEALCGINATSISAHVEFDYTVIQDIISKIDGKILDTLFMLEKEFENLDDLDIATKEEEEIQNIVQHIKVILYDDSISIGDNNKIKNSDIVTNQ